MPDQALHGENASLALDKLSKIPTELLCTVSSGSGGENPTFVATAVCVFELF